MPSGGRRLHTSWMPVWQNPGPRSRRCRLTETKTGRARPGRGRITRTGRVTGRRGQPGPSTLDNSTGSPRSTTSEAPRACGADPAGSRARRSDGWRSSRQVLRLDYWPGGAAAVKRRQAPADFAAPAHGTVVRNGGRRVGEPARTARSCQGRVHELRSMSNPAHLRRTRRVGSDLPVVFRRLVLSSRCQGEGSPQGRREGEKVARQSTSTGRRYSKSSSTTRPSSDDLVHVDAVPAVLTPRWVVAGDADTTQRASA